MAKKILDIYSDYLICQNKYATATGLSDLLSGDISHDKITKYLNSLTLRKFISSFIEAILAATNNLTLRKEIIFTQILSVHS